MVKSTKISLLCPPLGRSEYATMKCSISNTQTHYKITMPYTHTHTHTHTNTHTLRHTHTHTYTLNHSQIYSSRQTPTVAAHCTQTPIIIHTHTKYIHKNENTTTQQR